MEEFGAIRDLHPTVFSWAELLEAWLELTSAKYHDNLLILMLHNQWLALTMLRANDPRLLYELIKNQ